MKDWKDMENRHRHSPRSSDQNRVPDREIPTFDSEALFGQGRQVMIHHNADIYILRITRNGKLIMNK